MALPPLRWVTSSLSRKYAAGTAGGLFLVSLVFLVIFITMYRNQLQQEREDAAHQVNDLLRTSLEAAMLRRDLPMLRSIIEQLGRQEGIRGVFIINRSGDVRFSSHPQWLDTHPSFKDCEQCDFDPARTTLSFSFFTHDERGHAVLRTVQPVRNKPPCKQCHGPAHDNPVNGTLIVDHDASALYAHAWDTTLLLTGSGALVVLITLTGGWWFMRRFVIIPVAHLTEVSEALAAGRLDTRVSIKGRDELAFLGERFNQMAASLQKSLDEIRYKENFLQSLVDANPDGIRVIDEDYRIVLANKTYTATYADAPETVVGNTCYASTHKRDAPCAPTMITCPLEHIKRASTPIKTLHEHQAADGRLIAVEIYAAPMTVEVNGSKRLMLIESIRDLEKAVQVSHEQKLSEIGELAAGVAHEIHNPLASVRIALDSLTRLPADERAKETQKIFNCLSLVDREIDRCIGVTERLLKMSMFAGGETQIVSVNEAISDTLSLLSWEASETGVTIETRLNEEAPRILANESDIRIVVLNLAQNAFHAMPEGGTLRVQTERANGTVTLVFEDTGHGIPAVDLQKIFNPFFSRRADGVHGTGLGLAICKSLIERYKGSISVTSKINRGSRFTVRFPDPDDSTEDEGT